MTFESIDDDEYETAATRPRPKRVGRRAERRRLAIVGAIALAADGIATARDIERAVHRAPGTLYADLAALEHHGRIVSQNRYVGGWPRGLEYRLATAEECATRQAVQEAIDARIDETRRIRQHPWWREGG